MNLMFAFLNHHHGRTDASSPLSFEDVITIAISWSSLLDDEWIGFRPVGAHSDETVVWQRGPFINPIGQELAAHRAAKHSST